ncbi:MAG: 30S ribosomal protein S6 [Gemmatimonadetes bacterium]|nr:30S ribosomal protein S6 [Gemmatimonadota bacterium]
MRRYEVVYIFDPVLEEGAVEEKLESFHAVLGGEVAKIDHWGARQLAYPIQKSRSGYYVVVRLSASPEALPEFERVVKLDQETLRYLVVMDEGLPTSGESILGAVHRPRDGAPETEGETDGEDAAAEGGKEAGGAAEEDGEPDGPSEEGAGAAADASADAAPDTGADTDAEEGEGAGAGADPAADTDAEEGAEEATDGEEEETGEPSPPGPRAGPPEYAGVRGRGRRREGPPIVRLNYKDVATLSRFLNDQGKILPKRTTRVTARFQRELGTAVKRARFLALLPYIRDHGG